MTREALHKPKREQEPSSRRKREDNGFFGPGSPTWKVWTSPTSLIGFTRSIVVESFDPFLAAAVDQQNGVRRDPYGRLNRTGTYFQTIAVGDSRAAIRASEWLMKVHAKAVGIEPITGTSYSANNPDSQLWIHITGWHSVLYAYERYGPGRLSPEEEKQYWAECVVAAELQTCDPAKIPRSRNEVRAYYQAVRPRLCMSEHARELIHYFLFPKLPHPNSFWLTNRLLAMATIATIPKWMRVLGGFEQSSLLDSMLHVPTRALIKMLTPLSARLKAVDQVMPSIRPLWESALGGEAPIKNEIITPAQARLLYGSQGASTS